MKRVDSKADPASTPGSLVWFPAVGARWLHRIDPGAHRRIKGLRLVSVRYRGDAWHQVEIVRGLPDGAALNSLAGGFALWASVSEGRATRAESSRDLLLLSTAAALGAASFIFLAPCFSISAMQYRNSLWSSARSWWATYAIRLTGTGIGSQIYIGQLLAYGAGLSSVDLPMIVVAGPLAALASIVPRVLSGPAEHPPPSRLRSQLELAIYGQSSPWACNQRPPHS